jgi:hypothetical protein
MLQVIRGKKQEVRGKRLDSLNFRFHEKTESIISIVTCCGYCGSLFGKIEIRLK